MNDILIPQYKPHRVHMEPQKATFQLVGYRFPAFSFDVTKCIAEDELAPLALRFVPSGEYDRRDNKFYLKCEMYVGTDRDEFVHITCEAEYKFEGDDGEIPSYFYANSIAIVYPYVRAFCSLITTQSNNKGIILPILNLTSLGDELRRNTIYSDNGTGDNAISSSSWG